MSQSDKKAFIVNVLFITVIIALAYFVFKYLLVWLAPFVVGLVLALILQPMINWILRNSHLERSFVAPVLTAVLLIVLMFVFVLFSFRAISEVTTFIAGLPDWFQRSAPQVIDAVNLRLEKLIEFLPAEWEAGIRDGVHTMAQSIQSRVGDLSAAALTWVANAAATLPGALIKLIITVAATFFICSQFDAIKAFVKRQIPQKYRGIAGETWVTFGRTLKQMLTSYLLIMFITFCELAIGLTLLRVDHSVLMAALISLVDILPVLGTGTILIPWGLTCLLIGNMGRGIGLILIYIIITVLRNIIEPKLIGQRIGLPPLVTLMAMYLGLHILGLPGVFIFPLLIILLRKAQEAGGMIRVWHE